jgi:hypothetical protein
MTAAPSWPRVLLRSEDSDQHLSVIETGTGSGGQPAFALPRLRRDLLCHGGRTHLPGP